MIKRLSCLFAALLLLPLTALAQGGIQGYAAAEGIRYLQLGEYPALNNGGRAPILWRVLQADQEEALLLSDLVLDSRAAHEGAGYRGFEHSSLAAWLQEQFVQAAFDHKEQHLLMPQDQGFLVSLPTAQMLRDSSLGFENDAHRVAQGTAYATARGLRANPQGGVSYWIAERSQTLKTGQRRIRDDGVFAYSQADTSHIGVRPVIRLNLSLVRALAGDGSRETPYVITPGDPPPTPVPSPTPPPTPKPTGTLMLEGFPPLTAEGFLPEGVAPYLFEDEENGLWRYASQSLRITITRHQDKEKKLRWFESELVFAEGEYLRMYPNEVENKHKMLAMEKIADKHNLVYAMNGDYYIYRVNRAKQTNSAIAIGRVARDGVLLYDKAVSDKRSNHPNLDVMALYPDGRLSVHKANEKTAEELLALGACDVLSFGPVLVRDGVIDSEAVSRFGTTQQPRAGLGMLEQRHFIHLMVESRTSKSKGVDTAWMAERFKELGCDTAFNLDGGQTAVVIFMGKQLNEIGAYDSKTNSRVQNEVMGIGTRLQPDSAPED